GSRGHIDDTSVHARRSTTVEGCASSISSARLAGETTLTADFGSGICVERSSSIEYPASTCCEAAISMKRVLFVLIALAVAASAGWYYWQFSQRISNAPVAALLPRQTVFVAQIPDFNRALDEWQHGDLYQLYREPAVQEFLRKPLGN